MGKQKIGTLVEFSTTNSENLSKEAYIQKITEIAPKFQEAKENIIDYALSGTPHLDIKNLFYAQPFADWEEDAREDLFSSLDGYSSELGEMVDFAYSFNKEDFKRWEVEYNLDHGGEKLANDILRNIRIDMDSNNFRGASASIETYVDLFKDALSSFKEQCPDIDLEMPSYWDDQIRTSAESYDLIYGVDSESAKGFKLNTRPDDDAIQTMLNTSSEIAYIQSDGDYYIGSTSSEMNKNLVAYAYLQSDGDIPAEILESINLDKINSLEVKDELNQVIQKQLDKCYNQIEEEEEAAKQNVKSPSL